MPNFLTQTLPLYDSHLSGWNRDERRLYGGDAVLEELRQWKGESTDDLAVRLETAGYMPLPKNHTMTLSGHLSSQTPMPQFQELGEARTRDKIRGAKSRAELLWYNIDGIGQQGSEFLPWFDAVQERAMATGYRWILVEKPSLSVLQTMRDLRGGRTDGKVTGDEEEFFRPYAVVYSPTQVPFWQYTSGMLDFAVIRIPLVPTNLVDEAGNFTGTDLGFYLLVRRGFKGLGEAYAGGGWWKYDGNEQLVTDGDGNPATGTWDQTLGQIPLFQFIGEPSSGTSARPAIARSLTMELGQIAVGLMILRSARDYNIVQAAKSINWILGIDSEKHGDVIAQNELGSITIGVPPVMGPAGAQLVPSIWNSSAALLDSSAFESVIRSSLEEAREIMVKQVTSTPDSSGRSKEAGFAEATSPLLARLAATRQQAMNTFLYFASLRFGIPNPTASVQIPREFDLAPVVDDIDDMLSALKRSWLRSPTWERELLLKRGDERGMLPEDKTLRDTIEAELEASATPTEAVDPLLDDLSGTPSRQPLTKTPAPNPAGNGAVA
jgi:hypothetical protein